MLLPEGDVAQRCNLPYTRKGFGYRDLIKSWLRFYWMAGIWGIILVFTSDAWGGDPGTCQYLLKAQIYHGSIPAAATAVMENLRSGMLLELSPVDSKRFYPLYVPPKSLQETAAFFKSLPKTTAELDQYALRHGLILNMLSLTRDEFESLLALWLRDEREVVVNLSLRHVMDGIYKVFLLGQFGPLAHTQSSFTPTIANYREVLEILKDTIRGVGQDWRRSISPAQLSDFIALSPAEITLLSKPIDLKQKVINQDIFQKLLLMYAVQVAEDFRLNTIYRPEKRDQIIAQRESTLLALEHWEDRFAEILAAPEPE